MVYIVNIYYRLQVNKLDYRLWDLKTTTINDYSVELILTPELLEDLNSKFKTNYENNSFYTRINEDEDDALFR